MQDKREENKIMRPKTKVCFVITKGVWGGAQKYVYTLATSLAPKQYDVLVICGEGGILKKKLEEKNIRVYELINLKRDISIITEIKSSFALLKIIWREHPDVLHLNSPKASGFGAVAGRLCGIPKVIMTVHGWSFNEECGLTSEVLISFFSWLTTIFCHKIVVIAQREKEQALAMPFVNQKKVVLIRNGIEVTKYKEKSEAQKELLTKIKKTDVGNVLWLGTTAELHKNKGLKYSISAMAYIKTPFVFVIIGEGEERKNLENLIKELNLENKVFLIGFLNNSTEYLKAFDIFMLTSTKEGLPYTILEAGEASLPVIASNIGGIPDIIENGVSGILTTKSRPGEITRALEYLIANPDKQKLFGQNLKQKVEKEFSLEQMLEKTLKLYD